MLPPDEADALGDWIDRIRENGWLPISLHPGQEHPCAWRLANPDVCRFDFRSLLPKHGWHRLA
jgi:hypothetical protein